MNILCIDTSTDVCTICIGDEEKILVEHSIAYKKSHSIMLMPMVDYALKCIGFLIDDIDYIAIAKGPGSFTGLRIGASTVKAIAHALEKRIIPISTLEALAYNIYSDKYIVPIIDARSERIYAGIYKYKEGRMVCIKEDTQTTIREIMSIVEDMDICPLFIGDGANIYKDIILEKFSKDCIAKKHLSMQKGASLYALALVYIELSYDVGYDELLIDYLRLAQAERELIEKNKRENKDKIGKKDC